MKQLSVSLVRQGHKANKRVRGVGMGLEEEKKLFFLSKKNKKGNCGGKAEKWYHWREPNQGNSFFSNKEWFGACGGKRGSRN